MESLVGTESAICFFVNGKEIIEENADPEMTLLVYLRRHLGLTGSKLGCGEGGCGACTVMVSRYDQLKDIVRHYSVNACLAPLYAMDGLAITTVEGIGSSKTHFHPCQERIAKAHGSQCGFCTPGFVMSMYTLLRNNSHPSQEEMEHSFEGNLCRCTGYRPILDGYRTFCSDCPCKSDKDKESPKLFDATEFVPLDPTQEPIFPPKLKVKFKSSALAIQGPRVTWYRPITLNQLLVLRDSYPQHNNPDEPQYRLVMGNTEIGVETRIKGFHYPVLITPSDVPELLEIKVTDEGLLVGASVTFSQLREYCIELISSLPSYQTGVFQAIVEMLRWFAGPQIRNVSSLAGNIITASPISDLNPILLACQAKLLVASIAGQRTITVDPTFFPSYRKTSLLPNEVLVSVLFPFTNKNEHIMFYKQARRREDDISIVNACMCVKLGEGQIIESCHIAFGGMAPKTIMAQNTQKELVNRIWNKELLEFGCSNLAEELVLPPVVPGGMPDYRLSLALSFFYKFYLFVTKQNTPDLVSSKELSAFELFQRDVSKSSQGFTRISTSQPSRDTIGRPMMHLSALKQASGEAKYIDDLPHFENELYAALILSERAHAKFTIDTSGLDEMKGEWFVCAQDVPGSNLTGIMKDEHVFQDGVVTSVGQIIGVVLANTQPLAQQAAKKVKVNYTDLPAVLSIEKAIEKGQFLPEKCPVCREVTCGDVESALASAEFTCEGSMRTGGQEHFYLETNVCIAIPKGEDGEMEIIASSQCVSEAQLWAAEALGVPGNKIICRVKRIGGGFGGKETRFSPLTTAIAVAANKVGRPVRIMLDRNEDMIYSGHRHPFLGKYKVGYTAVGKITALEVELFSNGGHSTDLSVAVMERAVLHSTNAYYVSNVHVRGRVCQTNLPSNTAFRGFGGPQGMAIMEDVIDRIAHSLNMDPVKVREINLIREGQQTMYGLIVKDCHIEECWKRLIQDCCYYERRETIDEFNRKHQWKKRGLAIIPTMYGIAFGLKLLNQGGALLLVYKDGSVLLTHGGMEMGQGLHTKMIQVCSHCLEIPVEKIYLNDTATDKVPNASATASSSSSDLYGMAVKNACDQIMARLKPYKDKNPHAGWDKWVHSAYCDRVNLSAQGFYATEDIDFDWKTGRGRIYNYYCYGVGCSEVEIDTLTGDFKVLRSDLLMDVGDSLNPAIDIGQVEGAFTQGLGLFTMEECVFLKDGKLFTQGPGAYKIPSCSDIPIELNVSLMDHTPNPRAIFSSKAVGEPPLFLAASVLFAIKDAIRVARKERGYSVVFDLQTPATAERIRLACEDQFTVMAQQKMKDKYENIKERWNIIP